MHILLYDHTFEGFLTCIFDLYKIKTSEVCISSSLPATSLLFTTSQQVETCFAKSARVETHVKKKVSPAFYLNLKKIFITDCPDKELLLLNFFKIVIKNNKNVEDDFTNANILKVYQLARKIDKEVHRMHAFVRFENIQGIYISKIEPDFNLLPLVTTHFEKRYADQEWIIFDNLRKYGCAFDKNEISFFFKDDFTEIMKNRTPQQAFAHVYEGLWNDYIKAVNIPERKNLRLQAQHMPKKYWKHMVENKNQG